VGYHELSSAGYIQPRNYVPHRGAFRFRRFTRQPLHALTVGGDSSVWRWNFDGSLIGSFAQHLSASIQGVDISRIQRRSRPLACWAASWSSDLSDGAYIKTLNYNRPVAAVTFLPDGRFRAVCAVIVTIYGPTGSRMESSRHTPAAQWNPRSRRKPRGQRAPGQLDSGLVFASLVQLDDGNVNRHR